MNNRFLPLLLLGTVLLGSTASFALGRKTVYEDTKVRSLRGVIFIETKPDSGGRNAPIQELALVLKHEPRATHFKISWNIAVFGGGYKGLVVYNRASNTAELYAYETFEETVYRYHRIYTGVTEVILDKAARLHQAPIEDDNQPDVYGFFDELPKLGCKKQVFS